MNIEMTLDQIQAEKIYLSSATHERDYNPLGMEVLATLLKEEHKIKTSSSALGRWKKKFNWKAKLEAVVMSATVEDKEVRSNLEKSTGAVAASKMYDDFSANETINGGAYDLAKKQLLYYETQFTLNKKLSEKEMKVVVELLKITSDRKDKLLDRQSRDRLLNRMTTDEILEAMMKEVIEVEVLPIVGEAEKNE